MPAQEDRPPTMTVDVAQLQALNQIARTLERMVATLERITESLAAPR